MGMRPEAHNLASRGRIDRRGISCKLLQREGFWHALSARNGTYRASSRQRPSVCREVHAREPVNQQVLKTLRTLARERRSGILTCEGANVTRHVVFKDGGITAARSTDDNERLGECLVRQGCITEQHLKDATLFAKKGKRLGEVLADLRIIQESEIEDFVRLQILEVSSNVMIQPPKKMAFSNTKDVIQAVSKPVAVLDVIMEAARRTPQIEDHLKMLLEDDRHLSLTKDSMVLMERVTMKPHEAFILSRITGSEPTRSVFALSPLSEEQTARAVLGHLYVGILELRESTSAHGLAGK